MKARDRITELYTEIALLEPLADAEDNLAKAKRTGDAAGIKAAKQVILEARNAHRSMERPNAVVITGASAGEIGPGLRGPRIITGDPDTEEYD